MNKQVEVGDPAPDFNLHDQNRNRVILSQFRGTKKVVVAFHPLAWTGVCRTQMRDLEAHQSDFDRMGAVAVGLSVDSVPCKKAWAEAIEVSETALLSDFWPHGGVAIDYGVFREKQGTSERCCFIVDKEGIVRFKKVYPVDQVPDIDEIVRAAQGV